MATETLIQSHPRNASAHGTVAGHTPGVVVCRDAAGWLHARVADGGGEVTLQVEADERYWRLWRTVGGTSSMFERALTTPATATEVATALARWASTAGLSGRLVGDPHGAVRVCLVRVQ